MDSQLTGLHHVTAVTGSSVSNVRFYTQVLGLRLVKKTVNQDMTSAYHLFYADSVGNPGTDMTFFDWPHTPRNAPGAGEVAATSFLVPSEEALRWWQERLLDRTVQVNGIEERNDRQVLVFKDNEGQRLELIAGVRGASGALDPWTGGGVPLEFALQGLATVTLSVAAAAATSVFLESVLGFRKTGEYSFADNPARKATVFACGNGGLGTEVHIEERPDLPASQQGIGGVHHVAFRVSTDDDEALWQKQLSDAGVDVTRVIDRFYFRSIYFREPGGVLFEIATDGPGFATDEDVSELGKHLSLPPFLEERRAEIEARLVPIAI